MAKRQVVQSITLGRGKDRIELKPGQVFDFTKDELAALEAVNPNAISAKVAVDLDDPAATLKTTTKLASNEKSAPDAGGVKADNGGDL